ncbi:hypothetical protein, partial [Candidatus Venteria ishoeyi]|uniref:hypothetical protein n=1 Tax=Candidatus Venteria ishoeyi TaxID=1899563 RepID=UPI0015B18359
ETWEGGFRLKDSEGLYGIALLVQRHPFNKIELRNQLAVFSKKINAQTINSILEFMGGYSPGFQSFFVKTINTISKCED